MSKVSEKPEPKKKLVRGKDYDGWGLEDIDGNLCPGIFSRTKKIISSQTAKLLLPMGKPVRVKFAKVKS